MCLYREGHRHISVQCRIANGSDDRDSFIIEFCASPRSSKSVRSVLKKAYGILRRQEEMADV